MEIRQELKLIVLKLLTQLAFFIKPRIHALCSITQYALMMMTGRIFMYQGEIFQVLIDCILH